MTRRVPTRYGTYTVVGNRLTRNVVGALNPNNEGQQISDLFRIEGDTLVGWDPATRQKADSSGSETELCQHDDS